MPLAKKLFSWRRIIFLFLITLTIVLAFNLVTPATTIAKIDYIGQAILPTGTIFKGTEVGGLSGITYDSKNDVYYAISDDRSQKAPARFYTLKINLNQGKLQNGGVVPVGVTTLLNENGQPFTPASIDPEGIAVTNNGSVFVSSEGDAGRLINPFVKEFALASGQEIKNLPIPNKFLPVKNGSRGIRNNLAFESLTLTPDQNYLYTATENALLQDGSAAKPKVSTPCRILQYNLQANEPEKEFLYPTEPVKPIINIEKAFNSGFPDFVALDNQGNFLTLERTFIGLGFRIYLFEVSLDGADDIHQIESLSTVDLSTIKPVKKKLLLDMRSLKLPLDNIEGLTLGPQLSNGQRLLIVISDNNFKSPQRTQVLAFAMTIKSPLMRAFDKILQIFQ